MKTKFQSYYERLEKDLEDIKNSRGFMGDGALSKAFGFWFLKNEIGLSDQEADENIIDGNDDHGIDAFYLNKQELSLFQFKYPKVKNINKEISNDAILKLFDGVEYLIDSDDNSKTKNDGFNGLIDILKGQDIYTINLYTVSYSSGVFSQKSLINDKIKKLKKLYGTEFHFKDFSKEEIVNIYDRLQRTNNNEVKIKYINMNNSDSIGDDTNEIESWVGTVEALELVNSVKDELGSIFDENIRLLEKNSNINREIVKTASDPEESKMFYFYNNGITFICDDAKISSGNNIITLKGAAIVNGCQTVNSLFEAYENSELKNQVHLLVRILKISTYDERQAITQYLNSQNPIKESYFISNNTIIIDLQKKLLKNNIYLERQINEVSYRKKYSDNDTYNNYDEIYKLENVVQHYVGAYKNKMAARAKSEKSSLFNRKNIEDTLSEISAEKVIKVEKLYKAISEVCTKYRKNRRNSEKDEIIEFLKLDKSTYNSQNYLFINTGDILILNTVVNMNERYNKFSEERTTNELIRKSIFLIKNLIVNDEELSKTASSSITKSKKIYEKEQNYIQGSSIENLDKLG